MADMTHEGLRGYIMMAADTFLDNGKSRSIIGQWTRKTVYQGLNTHHSGDQYRVKIVAQATTQKYMIVVHAMGRGLRRLFGYHCENPQEAFNLLTQTLEGPHGHH